MTEELLETTELSSTESQALIEKEAVQSDETGTPSEKSIDELKAEISDLRALLEQQDTIVSKKVREMEEFNRLFPTVSLSDLPSEVTDRANAGIPLAAAYALYEKEMWAKKEKAGEVNRKNAFLSAGKAGTQTSGEFFTPDEVRAMSPAQVHENYSKIRESMKHWRNKTFY